MLEVDAREYQATDPGGDEELRSDYVVEGELDLDTWARDLVGLGLPDQILCRPDCAGLCPVCGKDLNLEPHVHDEVAVGTGAAMGGEPSEVAPAAQHRQGPPACGPGVRR